MTESRCRHTLKGYTLPVGFSYSLVKYDEVGNGDDNESESAMTRRVIALMRCESFVPSMPDQKNGK